MVTVDKAQIAEYRSKGHVFEILIDPDLAMGFKKGTLVDVRQVLAVEKIFHDAKKGLEANHTIVKSVFGTDDPVAVAADIIRKGTFSLTAEYKKSLRDQKTKQILDIIHKNGVDPKTKTPHPLNRIHMVMEEAKVKIDEFEDVQQQVQEVLKKIRPLLPIAFVMKEISVRVPAPFAGKSHGVLQSFGTKKKEEWMSDGSLYAVVEIPGGLEQDFYDKLNAACHGHAECSVIATR